MGSFHEPPRPAPLATVDAPVIGERPGTVIGPYKLLEQIGEGGLGAGLHGRADSSRSAARSPSRSSSRAWTPARSIARFEAERQALALMDHPNIARVLDAGETASGRPYFVMELVKGVPITDYCDQNRLTHPASGWSCSSHVCQAVQHAHQKGIIHRDLKPSNVLVTLHDGTPVVKVIDFGIAKATGAAADRQDAVHRLRADDRHAAVHDPGAGRSERPGRRHAQRHLFAGRAPVRAVDRHDAVRPGTAAGGGLRRDAADHPRGRAAQAEHPSEHAGPGSGHGLGAAAERSASG